MCRHEEELGRVSTRPVKGLVFNNNEKSLVVSRPGMELRVENICLFVCWLKVREGDGSFLCVSLKLVRRLSQYLSLALNIYPWVLLFLSLHGLCLFWHSGSFLLINCSRTEVDGKTFPPISLFAWAVSGYVDHENGLLFYAVCFAWFVSDQKHAI